MTIIGVPLESYYVLFIWAAPNEPPLGKLQSPRGYGREPQRGITLGYPPLRVPSDAHSPGRLAAVMGQDFDMRVLGSHERYKTLLRGG